VGCFPRKLATPLQANVYVDRYDAGAYTNTSTEGGSLVLPPNGVPVTDLELHVLFDHSLFEVRLHSSMACIPSHKLTRQERPRGSLSTNSFLFHRFLLVFICRPGCNLQLLMSLQRHLSGQIRPQEKSGREKSYSTVSKFDEYGKFVENPNIIIFV
jgi:hypothetical protein